MKKEYRPVPVAAAADIAKCYDKSIVIIFAWDPVHGLLHTTTWGRNKQECEWAAQGGDIASVALGTVPELRKTYEDFRKKS